MVRDPFLSPRSFSYVLSSFSSHLLWRLTTQVFSAGTLDVFGGPRGSPGSRESSPAFPWLLGLGAGQTERREVSEGVMDGSKFRVVGK